MRNRGFQRLQHAGADAIVGRKKRFDGGGECRRLSTEVRGVPARAAEVLVACRTLLAIPSLLVNQFDRSQQAEPLDREGDVGQVGDGAMPVLEVEGVEELFGALGADLGKRLLHRKRRAGVLGHRVSQNLGVCSVDCVDVGLGRFFLVLWHGTSEYVMPLRMFRVEVLSGIIKRVRIIMLVVSRRFMSILAGRIALITGASQGIGRACALELARGGASVALAARNLDKLAEVAAEITPTGGTAHAFALDVASEESIKECAKAVIAHFGGSEYPGQ